MASAGMAAAEMLNRRCSKWCRGQVGGPKRASRRPYPGPSTPHVAVFVPAIRTARDSHMVVMTWA